MSIINLDDAFSLNKPVNIHQAKYNNGFRNDLITSHDLVDKIITKLRSKGLYARDQDDVVPFQNQFGELLRLWDIEVLSKSKMKRMAIEAKDYARMIYYDLTGLPQKYIDERLMLKDKGEGLFLIFRDNFDFVNGRAKNTGRNTEEILYDMERKGFAIKENNIWNFVPYGNELSFLMNLENRDTYREKTIRSNLSKYRGQLQYLWKIESMLPIDKLIDQKII